jgi:hypothetical protein
LSLVTMVRPGPMLRVIVLVAAAVALAACGDDAETPAPVADTPPPVATAGDTPTPITPEAPALAATPAPVATTSPAATPVPAAPPTEVAAAPTVDTTMLLGDWAPDAATCSQGMVMTVGNNGLGGAALGVAQCVINSRTREGDALTVVAACSSPDTAFRSVTMTLQATVVGDAPPATMTILQQGDGLAEAATLPISLVRCAAAPAP